MDITDKIDGILSEATAPSQNNVLSTLSKGLQNVSDITGKLGMSLWHYLNIRMLSKGSSFIFKSQPSMKIMDELWHRTAKSLEDSEQLTPQALKKLKSNFYSLHKWFDKLYTWNSDKNAWEYTG